MSTTDKKYLDDAKKKHIQELAPHEVQPPEQFQTIKRKTFSQQDCYAQAQKYIFSLNAIPTTDCVRLVHGHYGDMVHMGHAWVELPGNIVFDGVVKRFYDKAGYYKVMDVSKDEEYSPKEAAELMLRYKHWGPWKAELKK